MSTISKTELEQYIAGHFHKDEKERACDIACDTVKKVLLDHAENVRRINNPYEAGSLFLGYVDEILQSETGEIAEKIDSAVQQLFRGKERELSEFYSSIEWGAIDCLKDLFKQHRI